MMERMPQPKRMSTKAKYERILAALALLCNGKSLTNLKRAGLNQIHYWHKSCAVVVSGENDESQILVSRPKTHRACSRLNTSKKYFMICWSPMAMITPKGIPCMVGLQKFMQTSLVLFARHLWTFVWVASLCNSISVHWLDCDQL